MFARYIIDPESEKEQNEGNQLLYFPSPFHEVSTITPTGYRHNLPPGRRRKENLEKEQLIPTTISLPIFPVESRIKPENSDYLPNSGC
jgi:hypothetical protein